MPQRGLYSVTKGSISCHKGVYIVLLRGLYRATQGSLSCRTQRDDFRIQWLSIYRILISLIKHAYLKKAFLENTCSRKNKNRFGPKSRSPSLRYYFSIFSFDLRFFQTELLRNNVFSCFQNQHLYPYFK